MSSGNGAGLQGAASILADEGVKGLYTGYSSNIAYAFPADAIKFLVRRTRGPSATFLSPGKFCREQVFEREI